MTTKPTISRKHTKAALHLFAIHQTRRLKRLSFGGV